MGSVSFSLDRKTPSKQHFLPNWPTGVAVIEYISWRWEVLGQDEWVSLRAHVDQGAVHGSDRFQRQTEELTGGTPRHRPQGCPRKSH